MDFTSELISVNSSLTKLIQSEGSLIEPCNENKTNSLISMLKSELSTILSSSDDVSLRRITIYLILNSDLSTSDLLLDNFDYGHLVNPRINLKLLVNIVWELSLEKYFYECITFCPPAISNDLLDCAIHELHSLEFNICIERSVELAAATFAKINVMSSFLDKTYRDMVVHICSKLIQWFNTLIDFIMPNLETFNFDTIEGQMIFGKRILSVLKLNNLCFTCMLVDKGNMYKEYEISLEQYSYSHWEVNGPISILDFCNKLVTSYLKYVHNITASMWCQWVELDSDVSGKSLQKAIGEESHHLLSTLDALSVERKKEMPVETTTAMQVLATMTITPREEDDDIRDASDVAHFMRSIDDKSKSQGKWLRAFLKLDWKSAILSREDCLECVERNVGAMNQKDCHLVLENIVCALDEEIPEDYVARLKDLGLNCMKSLTVDDQIHTMKTYFNKLGLCSSLKACDFDEVTTQIFNRAVLITDDNKHKFFTEFIGLCLQSPEELIEHVLMVAMTNSNQVILMVDILQLLKPVCNFRGLDAAGNQMEHGLLLKLLMDFMREEHWTLHQIDNFVHIIELFLESSVLDEKLFIEECLFPAICDKLKTSEWPKLLLFLQTLGLIVSLGIERVEIVPLLVLVSHVTQQSRCNLTTFTSERVAVCNEAVCLLKIVLPLCAVTDRDVKFLRWKLARVSPINKISAFESVVDSTYDSLLFHLLQSDTLDLTRLPAVDDCKRRMTLLQSLVKTLPTLTPREWRTLPGLTGLRLEETVDTSVAEIFHLLIDALLILSSVVSKEFSVNESSLACLQFSVRNFTLILQDSLLPHLDAMESREVITFFCRCMFLLESLPQQVKEACAIFLTKILIEMLPKMNAEEDKVGRKITNVETCCLIALSSVMEARLALSRSLADLTESHEATTGVHVESTTSDGDEVLHQL